MGKNKVLLQWSKKLNERQEKGGGGGGERGGGRKERGEGGSSLPHCLRTSIEVLGPMQ